VVKKPAYEGYGQSEGYFQPTWLVAF